MESELGNNAVDGPFADTKVTLSEFLSDNFGACFGIKEAVADNLADEFLSATVMGSGTSLRADQSLATFFKKKGPQLEVALTAVAEFVGNLVNAFGAAFTVDKHGELAGDFIGFGNGKGTELTLDTFFEKFERNHRASP